MPEDWQETVVNGAVRYWVRIKVDTGFSTAPIGTQITAISELAALSVRN
jgi:hypothetical protein